MKKNKLILISFAVMFIVVVYFIINYNKVSETFEKTPTEFLESKK